MDPATLLLAAALGTDAALVSLSAALGMERFAFRPAFRLSFHFGLFQAGMTLAGWAAGESIRGLAAGFGHWIAFALLAAVGVKMICEDGDGDRAGRDPSRGLLLVTLAVATSLDALAVGAGLAMAGGPIAVPAALIGLVTAAMCAAAVVLGAQGRRLPGLQRRAATAAGLVLIAIGVRILVRR